MPAPTTTRIDVTLTADQKAALQCFLGRVRYGDVYRHIDRRNLETGVPGDGNKAGSASDREARMTLDAIYVLKAAIDRA